LERERGYREKALGKKTAFLKNLRSSPGEMDSMSGIRGAPLLKRPSEKGGKGINQETPPLPPDRERHNGTSGVRGYPSGRPGPGKTSWGKRASKRLANHPLGGGLVIRWEKENTSYGKKRKTVRI